MSDPVMMPRCGDHVLHRPSDETWVVAWAEGEYLAWAGWPDGRARLADCKVTYRCPDDEHRKTVELWRNGADESRRDQVLRLYATAVTRAGTTPGQESGGG